MAVGIRGVGFLWDPYWIQCGIPGAAWRSPAKARSGEEAVRLGAGEILLTSMDGDGTKKGYDLPMLKAVCDAVTVPVIASGGAGSVEHFVDAVKFGNASAVLAASVFHFGEISISEVKRAMAEANITIRNSM